MSNEYSVSCAKGNIAEWHDSILEDGRRKGGLPHNADKSLQHLNEHLYGDSLLTDGERINKIYEDDVKKFNDKQDRPSRKMGMESSVEKRQKSYYEGLVDGTFCFGKGKNQEVPIYEVHLQIGNKDDNGVTDKDFDIEKYYDLKSEDEDKASAYVQEHLNKSESVVRSKRILKKTVERLVSYDPEHFVVMRADLHSDEPCGTPGVHLAFNLRGTGYKSGMENRCSSTKALEQMDLRKEPDKEWGIVQLYDKVKDIMEEEMLADGLEYGYEPMKRKAPTGEKKEHMTVEEFRLLKAGQQALVTTEQAVRDMAQQMSDDLDIREENLNIKETDLDTKKTDLDAREVSVSKREHEVNEYIDKNVERKTKEIQENYDTKLQNAENTIRAELKAEYEKKYDDEKKALEESYKEREDAVKLREDNADARDIEQDDRESDLNAKADKIALDQKNLLKDKLSMKKWQEKKEAEFQVKEDALDAQKRAEDAREAENSVKIANGEKYARERANRHTTTAYDNSLQESTEYNRPLPKLPGD